MSRLFREHPLQSLSYDRELHTAATKMCMRAKKRIIVSRKHGRRVYRRLRKALKKFSPKFREDINVMDLIYQRRYMKPHIFQLQITPPEAAEEAEEDEAPMGVAPGRHKKKRKTWSPKTATKLVQYTNAIIKIPLEPGSTSKKMIGIKPKIRGRSKRRRLYMVMAWRAYKGKDIIFPKWFAVSVMKRLRKFPKKLKKPITIMLKKVGPDEYRVIVKKNRRRVIHGKN